MDWRAVILEHNHAMPSINSHQDATKVISMIDLIQDEQESIKDLVLKKKIFSSSTVRMSLENEFRRTYKPSVISNYITKVAPKLDHSKDATDLLNYFFQRAVEDPLGIFKCEVNSDGSLNGVFWMSSEQRLLTGSFGEVIMTDNTHQTNLYRLY